jgi:hypothetical protein
MDGKIDFIVCEEGGSWYIESLNVPAEIASQTDSTMVQWAKAERFKDEPDVVFVGVYWRDQILDESGLSTETIISNYNKTLHKGNNNARN